MSARPALRPEVDLVIDLRDGVAPHLELPRSPRVWTALIPPEWMQIGAASVRAPRRTYGTRHRLVSGPSVNLLRDRRKGDDDVSADAFTFRAHDAD